MLGLEPGAWGAALHGWAARLRGIKAILALSAHWQASELAITSSASPATLHDFSGFPEGLSSLRYPAPGDPVLAARVQALLAGAGFAARLDPDRPLDHGAWVPLLAAFPEASTPVIQLALPRPRTPGGLFELGQTLGVLRQEGVLIVASGGIVHNLGLLDWGGDSAPAAWAQAFEAWVAARLERGEHRELLRDCASAPHYPQAVPTSEHFDPLYFALGAAGDGPLSTVYQGWQLGSLSLRSWAWG